jgi:hypothetical protein
VESNWTMMEHGKTETGMYSSKTGGMPRRRAGRLGRGDLRLVGNLRIYPFGPFREILQYK